MLRAGLEGKRSGSARILLATLRPLAQYSNLIIHPRDPTYIVSILHRDDVIQDDVIIQYTKSNTTNIKGGMKYRQTIFTDCPCSSSSSSFEKVETH